MADPLAESRLRLDRAKFHLDELDTHFRSYCASAQVRYYPEVADTPWNIQIEGDPTFAVIVGEAIQNIRSALDYLVYALVLHTGGRKPRNKTQFPLTTSAYRLYSTRDQISELPGELRRRIRKLQPYQSKSQRSTTLNQLRDLSNSDKHRLLLVTKTEIGGPKVRLRRPFKPDRNSTGVCVPVYLEDTEAEKKILRGDPNIAAILYVTLIIEEKGIDADAFEALKRFLWTATEIVNSFSV